MRGNIRVVHHQLDVVCKFFQRFVLEITDLALREERGEEGCELCIFCSSSAISVVFPSLLPSLLPSFHLH